MIERALIGAAILTLVIVCSIAVKRWNAHQQAGRFARIEISSANRPRLLVFSSRGCKACVTQRKMIDEATKCWSRNIDIVYHDAVDDWRLARQFGIMMVPALVVASANGTIIGVRQGLVEEDGLRSLVEAAA